MKIILRKISWIKRCKDYILQNPSISILINFGIFVLTRKSIYMHVNIVFNKNNSVSLRLLFLNKIWKRNQLMCRTFLTVMILLVSVSGSTLINLFGWFTILSPLFTVWTAFPFKIKFENFLLFWLGNLKSSNKSAINSKWRSQISICIVAFAWTNLYFI